MRLEYTEEQERDLRITEIVAILENNLFEDKQHEMELAEELAMLLKPHVLIEDWERIWRNQA